MVYCPFMLLKTYLKTHDVTGKSLAEQLGVSHITISRYIRGRRFPSPEMIMRIAEATGGKVKVADWYAAVSEQMTSPKHDERVA